jgi:Protein of unknown function (DUF3754)
MTRVTEDESRSAEPERDQYIPVRKSDILAALIDHGSLASAGEREKFRQLCWRLGAIYHYQFFAQLEKLRDDYYYFNPEVEPPHVCAEKLDSAHAELVATLVSVLKEANFVAVSLSEIDRAHSEHHVLRVAVDTPMQDYREILCFRRGHRREKVEIRDWFGLRRRTVEVTVYDRVALLVMIRPAGELSPKELRRLARSKLRPGSILIKYFRDVARPDLDMLFPQVRVVMTSFDKLKLAIPAVALGIPIVLKLLPTVTVLLVVAGFYLGFRGTIGEDEHRGALVALSGVATLGGFLLQQWTKYQRQALKYHKALSENVYFRNLNNNAGIFDYLIGAAEEQDVKEAFLAYYFLHTAAAPLDQAGLEAVIETWLRATFAIEVEFDVADALAKLESFGLLARTGEGLAVPSLDATLVRLDRIWGDFFPAAPASTPA